MNAAAVRTLRVLLTKYERDAERATDAMSAALRALRAAQSEREQSELRVAAARQNVDEHRRRSIVARGVPVDAESLRWAHGYRVRLDEALVAEQQRCAALVEAERQAAQSVERARVALAECKGKVEVVQKRIDQALKAQRDKAEAQAEEESADRSRPR